MSLLPSRRAPTPPRIVVVAQAALLWCACSSGSDGSFGGVGGPGWGSSSTGGGSSSGAGSTSGGSSSSGAGSSSSSGSSSGGASSSGATSSSGTGLSTDAGSSDGGSPTDGGFPVGDGGYHARYTFSVSGTKTLLNGQPIIAKGFRTSNALLSDQTANDLISSLDAFVATGINTISVYVMGSRYGNIAGYLQDASLDPTYAARLGRIIEAADARGVVVLVGCLYWGTTTGKWDNWTQQDADKAIANTTAWAKSHGYRNVFFDPDNEGMAIQGSKNIKNLEELVQSGKNGDASAVMASNYGPCASSADLCIHISQHDPAKPYIETEGGGSWSYASGNYAASAVGVYTASEEQGRITAAQNAYKGGEGWMLASMWLQAVPPLGPHTDFGGDGITAPGVAWWTDWLKTTYGAYVPPPAM